MNPTTDTDELVKIARFGLEIESDLKSPVIQLILEKLGEKADESLSELSKLDPELQAPIIRKHQAMIAGFREIARIIEDAVNDGRAAVDQLDLE